MKHCYYISTSLKNLLGDQGNLIKTSELTGLCTSNYENNM